MITTRMVVSPLVEAMESGRSEVSHMRRQLRRFSGVCVCLCRCDIEEKKLLIVVCQSEKATFRRGNELPSAEKPQKHALRLQEVR